MPVVLTVSGHVGSPPVCATHRRVVQTMSGLDEVLGAWDRKGQAKKRSKRLALHVLVWQ